jgi:hypothetical protein
LNNSDRTNLSSGKIEPGRSVWLLNNSKSTYRNLHWQDEMIDLYMKEYLRKSTTSMGHGVLRPFVDLTLTMVNDKRHIDLARCDGVGGLDS